VENIMGGEEQKNSRSTPAAKILSLALGLILLFILYSNSNSMVSDTYTPAANTLPTSLVCRFVDLDFSKKITTSNITGEEYILLTIEMENEVKEHVIPTLYIQEIKEVGFLSWKNGEMMGILPSITMEGSYTIEQGYTTRFGKFGTQEKIEFLIVEKFHPLTEIERAIIQHQEVAWTILLLLLTATFSLILVPLFETIRVRLMSQADKSIII
jgi:hypothetical protein